MQALALEGLLERVGHRVAAILVGRSPQRAPPAYFLEQAAAPVNFFDSPNFVFDTARGGVRLGPSLVYNGCRLGRYRRAVEAIDRQVRRHTPDLIVNFFDPLGGVYNYLRRPPAPMVCVGHQYMFLHPAYRFPGRHPVGRRLLQRFAHLTALGAVCKLALSLYPAPAQPAGRLVVTPPLLRGALFDLPRPTASPFLLVYLLNRGYAREVIQWHERNPAVALHCFWDTPAGPAVQRYDETLAFHRLDGEKFLTMLGQCRGVACTAGFETVAEAMYLGKPVLLVPTAGHFEQYCNAFDAERSHAAVRGASFDLDPLVEALASHRGPVPGFRDWVAQAERRLLHALEAAAGGCARPSLATA